MTREEQNRGDPRVQRTRNLIIESLIDLTIEKGFAAVTVQDIVRRAGINRATFYRHYQDKFDLLDQYAQAVYALPDYQPELTPLAGGDAAAEKMVSGLTRIFEHIRQHAKFFRVMLGKNGDPAFAAKIRQYIQKRIRRSMPEALLSDKNSADLFLTFVSSGAVGIMSWWRENDLPYPPEQLATVMLQYMVANLPKGERPLYQPTER